MSHFLNFWLFWSYFLAIFKHCVRLDFVDENCGKTVALSLLKSNRKLRKALRPLLYGSYTCCISASQPCSLAALQRGAQESFLVGLPGGSTTKSSLPIDIWPFADVAASHIIPDVMPFKANKKQRIWILKENRKLLLISVLSRPTKLYIIILTENEKAVRSQGKSFNFMRLAAANIIVLLA